MAESPHTHIEAFAELTARLDDPFADRDHVLRRAGLDEGTYARLFSQWRTDLTARPTGPDKLAQRYGDAYEQAVLSIGKERRGEVEAADPRFLNADAQSFRSEAAAVPLHGEGEAPSASAAAMPAAPIAMAPAPVSPAPVTPAPIALMPVAPPPVVAAPVAPPPVAPPPIMATPPASWVPEGMRGFSVHGGTQLASDVPKGPALPFDPSAKPTLPKADPSVVPEGMRGFSVHGGTQLSSEVPKGPATPFEAGKKPLAAPPPPVPAMPVAPARAAQAAAPTAAPVLSLEQYASFFVELSLAPERRAELLDRYRITEEQRRSVDAYWQERRAADLDVWSAWSKACASYKAWLAQARGGR